MSTPELVPEAWDGLYRKTCVMVKFKVAEAL